MDYSALIEPQQKNHLNLKIEDFGDERSEGQKIGAFRNGLGMPIVKIITDDNIPGWVTKALKVELNNAGYSIINEGSPDNYLIEGKIIKVFAHAYILYHGRIDVQISVKKNNRLIFQKVYMSDKNGGINWFPLTSVCANTLKRNLQIVCKNFINDINHYLLVQDSNL